MEKRIGLCTKFKIIKKVLEKSPGMEFAIASLNPPYKGPLNSFQKKLLVELIKDLWKHIKEYNKFRNSIKEIRKTNYILYSNLRDIYLGCLKISCDKIIKEKTFLKPSP